MLLYKGTICYALGAVFVSPELSSGRDLVIQMSVWRAPSAILFYLSGAYLENRMTYRDDIWYVGGSRSEVAHAEFWAWQMPNKYLICIIYAKICPEHFSGTICPTWMIFGMWVGLGPKARMVTLMEVKGHQRSNGVNYVLWLPYWSKEALMQAENDDDLDGGQRYQRSNGVNYVLWLPYLVKRSPDAN